MSVWSECIGFEDLLKEICPDEATDVAAAILGSSLDGMAAALAKDPETRLRFPEKFDSEGNLTADGRQDLVTALCLQAFGEAEVVVEVEVIVIDLSDYID